VEHTFHKKDETMQTDLAIWHKALLLIFQAGEWGNDELLRNSDPYVTNRHYISPDLIKKWEERFGLDFSISSRFEIIRHLTLSVLSPKILVETN
jgi:hypothetical protein